jgi:branched-chain amino acid transport system ATP-binding protein
VSLLVCDNVEKAFEGVKALDGVSLEVPEGSLTAVIGPNGAGKTSLFNCISGVYRPTAGTITLEGDDVTGDEPHDIASRGVARMFQNLALFDQMTVLDNMMLGRHYLYETSWWQDMLWWGTSSKAEIAHRERVEEIIDFLHLEQYRKRPVGILPYGILKRVELGRALAMDPQLLLLDEPAAGLNQEETEDMARYLLDIKEQLGVTQILIEHELHFVLDLADNVAVLDFGEKIAEGPPDQIRKEPAVIEAYVGGAYGEAIDERLEGMEDEDDEES